MKKKILVLTNNICMMKVFRAELVEELLKTYDVFINAPYNGEEFSFFETRGCVCSSVMIDRRGLNPFKDIKLFFDYINLLKKTKPDIVLTFSIKSNIYGGLACQLCHIPYVSTVEGLGTGFNRGWFLKRIVSSLYFLGLRKVEGCFVLNQEIYDVITSIGISKEKLSFLPGMGVNLDYYRPQPYPKDTKPCLLTVGRVMKEKGFPELIAAADILAKEMPDLQWHVCGAPEIGEERLIEELKKRKNIIYHGQQSDLRPFYAMCYAVITTTTYLEGMSTVCLEGGASARPIIGTNECGVKETFDEAISGFGTKKGDVDDIARVIQRFFSLVAEERERMGLASRAKIEKTFDRRMVVLQCCDMVKRILSESANLGRFARGR